MRHMLHVDLDDDDVAMFVHQHGDRYELTIEGNGCAVALSGTLRQYCWLLAAMSFDVNQLNRPQLRLVTTP